MARCPDCNKFVPYDTSTEPEVEDAQIFDDEVQVNVRVVLCCEECGTELKESYQEAQESFEHECDPENIKEDFNPEEDEPFEVDDSSAVFHERMQTHTPKGKPIKNPRYAKKYYGAEVSVTIKCNKCGDSFDHMITTEEQASYFDDLNSYD
jgi:hypothetical protein